MSLGVRFKIFLAIWAFCQVLLPTYGLKMQVTSFSSSPTPLSASNLLSNSIPPSQSINSATILPNGNLQRLDANIFEPSINTPNTLTAPSLHFNDVFNNVGFFPDENFINAYFTEDLYNNEAESINNDLSNTLESIPDLIPSENHLFPTNYVNRVGMTGNFPINQRTAPNFQNNVFNTEFLKETIDKPNNANNFNPTIGQVLTTVDRGTTVQNIRGINKSFGTILNSNLQETMNNENNLMSSVNKINIRNDAAKTFNNFAGFDNNMAPQISNSVLSNFNIQKLATEESNAIIGFNNPINPIRPNSFSTLSNTEIISNLPDNVNSLPNNANTFKNLNVNNKNFGSESLNKINLIKNPNQIENVLIPQPRSGMDTSNLNQNSNNNLINILRSPNINYNDQTTVIDKINNNVIVNSPKNIPRTEENKNVGIFEQNSPSTLINPLPIRQNTINQIANTDITLNNNNGNIRSQINPVFNTINENNNVLSKFEAPIKTLASRNPFLDKYLPPINKLSNEIIYQNALADIETNQLRQNYNNVDIQPSIANQNILSSFNLPNITPNAPSYSVIAENQRIHTSNLGQVSTSPLSLQTEYINTPKIELPPMVQTQELNNFVNPYSQNPYANNVVNLQTFSPEPIGILPNNFGLLSSSRPSQIEGPSLLPTPLTSLPAVEFGTRNNLINYNVGNLQLSPAQNMIDTISINSPSLLSPNAFQQTIPNIKPFSVPDISSPQFVPSNVLNNINPQNSLNLISPIPVTQPREDIMSNVQIKPLNIANIPSNNIKPIAQEKSIARTEAFFPIKTFDFNNKVEVDTSNSVFNAGFTPYTSPFNSVFNKIQAVPSHTSIAENNVIAFNSAPSLDNNFLTPLYYLEPQTVFTQNHIPLSNSIQYTDSQPNTISYSAFNPVGLPNEIVNTPLYISPNSQFDIPINAQQFTSIPEIITSKGLQQNLSPRTIVTQELMNSFLNKNLNQYSDQSFLSPISNLPSVYTSNYIQDVVPALQQIPSVTYTNVASNIYPQINDILPTTGIVTSINDVASKVASDALIKLVSSKRNPKPAQFYPVTNLPPVNPYPPTSIYPPAPVYYNPAKPVISTPKINLNIIPTQNSYEVYEIPEYYTDDFVTDYSSISLFDIPDILELPSLDFDLEESNPFIPYMSSLTVKVLPIIEDVSLEPILPNNLLVNGYPVPSFLPSPNIPYPYGPQILDLQNIGKKSNGKDLERLISLLLLSELINGNDNCDWDNLDKLIALLFVT